VVDHFQKFKTQVMDLSELIGVYTRKMFRKDPLPEILPCPLCKVIGIFQQMPLKEILIGMMVGDSLLVSSIPRRSSRS
jgi:hypothetical protein